MAKLPEAHCLHIFHTSSEAEEILDDINGYIHGPVSRFIDKYFAKVDSVHEVDVVHSTAQTVGHRPSPEYFSQWFLTISSEELNRARGVWHTYYRPTSEAENAHFFLTTSTVFEPAAEKGWRDVQVIGQFVRDGAISYQDGLLALCDQARKVFASQPTRLFLHGFYMRGSLMELWVFDRSGMYSSDVLDLHIHYERLAFIIRSYRSMSDRDLGRNDIIRTDEAGSYITLKDDDSLSVAKLYLEDHPIALSQDLVGQGTTCYRAKILGSDRWDYVVKFKWRLARDRAEEELLKLATEKKVWGVVSLNYHEEIDSTANLRRGLRWGKYKRLLTGQQHQTRGSEGVGATEQRLSCGTIGVLAHTEETDRFLQNRIFTCVIVSPAGRPLRTFKTVLELLQALRDAIKGHWSLFQDAKILHQDVSAENIIITDARVEGDPKGILIDLDVAMNLDVGPSTPGEVVGTRVFMAIGVLRSVPHKYRHDLESFFYVFLWIIISNRSENVPESSKLRQWGRGSFHEIAERKTIDMDKNNFRSILEEFSPEFHSLKPLAESLRQTLFPTEDGAVWTATDSSLEAVNGLYGEIIGAFEEAITSEEENSHKQHYWLR